MKKLFTTIFAALLGATTMFAQEEENSYSFYRNGQLVPNGSTITITEYETVLDLGDVVFVEMPSDLKIKNNLDSEGSMVIKAVGIDNFASIMVCPGGNCIPWSNGSITSARIKIAGEAEEDPQCHISGDFASPFTYTGSLTLTVCDYFDDEDYSTITVIFDTTGSSIKDVKADKDIKCEVFNLCGKKIANSTNGLSKGVYIIKQNGSSRKVVIK